MAEKKIEKTRIDRITAFVSKNRITLLIVVCIIVVGVIAFGVTINVLNNQLDKKTAQVEQLHDDYAEWVNNTAELSSEEHQEVYLKLKEDLSVLIDSTRTGYPELRALFTLASLEKHKENYETAVESFLQIIEIYPDSHLAASSAMNAAVCYELLDMQEKAIENYQLVYELYADRSSEAPHAKFSIARLYEVLGETDKAIGAYRELSTTFPTSEWAKLAVSRLIILE